jgi:hypothetical protein
LISVARGSRITVTLTRVLELILDLAGDLVGEQHGAVVVDLGRPTMTRISRPA